MIQFLLFYYRGYDSWEKATRIKKNAFSLEWFLGQEIDNYAKKQLMRTTEHKNVVITYLLWWALFLQKTIEETHWKQRWNGISFIFKASIKIDACFQNLAWAKLC